MITRNGWYRGIVERILIDDDGMDILFAFIFLGFFLIRGTQYGSNDEEGKERKGQNLMDGVKKEVSMGSMFDVALWYILYCFHYYISVVSYYTYISVVMAHNRTRNNNCNRYLLDTMMMLLLLLFLFLFLLSY